MPSRCLYLSNIRQRLGCRGLSVDMSFGERMRNCSHSISSKVLVVRCQRRRTSSRGICGQGLRIQECCVCTRVEGVWTEEDKADKEDILSLCKDVSVLLCDLVAEQLPRGCHSSLVKGARMTRRKPLIPLDERTSEHRAHVSIMGPALFLSTLNIIYRYSQIS